MDIHQFVGALKFLEGYFGRSPSTKELAEQVGCSEATVIKYLQRAVKAKLIEQRDGKYMSKAIAAAYDAQKQ